MRRSSALVALLAFGCGTGIRPAARYVGAERAAIAGADEVGEAPTMPPDHVKLGTVRARCLLIEDPEEIDGVYLSDVDCSAARLMRAMKERAAHVGGSLLVGPRCRSRAIGGEDRTKIRCKADVARPGDDALWRLGSSHAGTPPERGWGDGPAADAWNIRVHFAPARRADRRASRRTDLVDEVARMPVSHVELGDVVTSCRRGCSRDSVREGVRVVAGRLGANSVVGIGCARESEGWTCTGTAAVYEVDPDTHPAAR